MYRYYTDESTGKNTRIRFSESGNALRGSSRPPACRAGQADFHVLDNLCVPLVPGAPNTDARQKVYTQLSSILITGCIVYKQAVECPAGMA